MHSSVAYVLSPAMKTSPFQPTAGPLTQLGLFAGAYLLASMLGQWLRVAHYDLPIWWPPSGLLLATLLMAERRKWPRFVAIAMVMEYLINAWLYHVSPLASLCISLTQSIESTVCAYVVYRCCGLPFRLQSRRDALVLVLAALLGPSISATAGSAIVAGFQAPAFTGTWPIWWLSDTAGMLIVTPVLLAFFHGEIAWRDWKPRHWIEAATLLTALALSGLLVFGGQLPLPVLILPPLVWAGVRFGLPGAAAAAMILTVIAVRYTGAWQAWFALPAIQQVSHALLVQSFMALAGIATALLLVVLNQRRAAMEALQRLRQQEHDTLEARIAERTAALHHSNERLRRLSARQDSLLEAERTRISRELHDDLGAAMTGVTMHVQMALTAGGDNLPPVRERLTEAIQLVDAANQSMHRIINDLRPSVLDHLGIWGSIEWLANQWQARTGMPCEITIDSALADSTFDDDRAMTLFRIVQESLTNVARHAEASRVDIVARLEDDALSLTIHDDGKGLGKAPPACAESMGLIGMMERARRFNGSLEVTNAAGGGTLVRLQLPLSA